jgi:hypothetical protein
MTALIASSWRGEKKPRLRSYQQRTIAPEMHPPPGILDRESCAIAQLSLFPIIARRDPYSGRSPGRAAT